MTPKEKAKELISKYSKITGWSIQSLNGWMLKEMAHGCVDEQIKTIETLDKPEYTAFVAKEIYTIEETEYDTHLHGYELLDFFEQVKIEIENL